MSTSFDKMFITADEGLQVGIITKTWLDYMKGIIPYDEFMRIYYCVFTKPSGTIFEDITTGDYEPLNVEAIL